MPESAYADDDELIRKAHFRLYARPKYGPAIWIREGIQYPQAKALRLAIEYDKRHGKEDPASKKGKKK